MATRVTELCKNILWRNIKIVQWLKPPDPALNTNNKKLRELLGKKPLLEKRILDIGSGDRKIDESIISFDIEKYKHVKILGDAHYLPFKDNKFDLIIITAVLEHVPYPKHVVCEIKRCLKNGGFIYVEVPFLQGYHSDPHDYQRYTIEGLKILFKDFQKIDLGVCVGPISVLTWYLRKLPTIFFKNIYIIKSIEFITGWMFFMLRYLDFIFVRAQNSHTLASGLYYVGVKDQIKTNMK